MTRNNWKNEVCGRFGINLKTIVIIITYFIGIDVQLQSDCSDSTFVEIRYRDLSDGNMKYYTSLFSERSHMNLGDFQAKCHLCVNIA